MSSSAVPGSSTISVDCYRQILMWPLELKSGNKARDNHTVFNLKEIFEKLPEGDRRWIFMEQGLLSSTLDAQENGSGCSAKSGFDRYSLYSSLVYFHPFVRDFLMPGNHDGEGEPKIEIYRRDDIKTLKIMLNYGSDTSSDTPVDASVERLWLIKFDVGIVFLIVETMLQGKSLETVLRYQDQFRRCTAPYFTDNGNAGHCPISVSWNDAAGRDGSEASRRSDDDVSNRARNVADKITKSFLNDDANERYLPVFEHWQDLLYPLGFCPKGAGDGVYLDHLLDDRIPLIAYLASRRVGDISRGDWVRLSFSDDPGSSAHHPYSRQFLADWEARYCYDRYWDLEPESAGWHTSRLVGCGHTLVCAGLAEEGFFMNAKSGAIMHFRLHYFLMELLVQLQYATLLKLSKDMAHCIDGLFEEKMGNGNKLFEEREKEIRHMVELHLRFTHEYWFLEVSNQDQAKELFRWQSDLLNLDQLYERVNREQEGLAAYMLQQVNDSQVKASNRLTDFATVGIFVGLIYGAWGAHWYRFNDSGSASSSCLGEWCFDFSFELVYHSVGLTLAFLLVTGVIYKLLAANSIVSRSVRNLLALLVLLVSLLMLFLIP